MNTIKDINKGLFSTKALKAKTNVSLVVPSAILSYILDFPRLHGLFYILLNSPEKVYMISCICYYNFCNALDYFTSFRITTPFGMHKKRYLKQSNVVL